LVSHVGHVELIDQSGETLSLFMSGVGKANHVSDGTLLDDLAMRAQLSDGRTNFHYRDLGLFFAFFKNDFALQNFLINRCNQ